MTIWLPKVLPLFSFVFDLHACNKNMYIFHVFLFCRSTFHCMLITSRKRIEFSLLLLLACYVGSYWKSRPYCLVLETEVRFYHCLIACYVCVLIFHCVICDCACLMLFAMCYVSLYCSYVYLMLITMLLIDHNSNLHPQSILIM